MNLPPQPPQPPQQPPPQPQIHQITDKKPIIEQPKSNDHIKNWQVQVTYPEGNNKKSIELKSKSFITPKYAYDFDKADFTRAPFFDSNFIKSTEPCQNLDPTLQTKYIKFDIGDRKLNMVKLQSAEFKGPDKLKQVKQQIMVCMQRIQQQQNLQQNQSKLAQLNRLKDQYEKEQADSQNLLKNVCAKTIEQISSVFHLSCTQKEEVTNTLKDFIYQELCNFLSFSNQNSRQRTNYYVPSQNMISQITNLPKYSQKMLQFEDIIYSRWWKIAYDKGYKSGSSMNNIGNTSEILPSGNDLSNEEYEPNLNEADFNNLIKLFKDNEQVHHRYDAEQLAKAIANGKRRALSQNGPWKKAILESFKESNLDHTFHIFETIVNGYLKNLESPNSQQANQMQNAPQQVQQMHPSMMHVCSPQGIGLPNVTSPINNVHMNPNMPSVNQRNFLSPPTVPKPANSNVISPSSSGVRRAPSSVSAAQQISSPPSTKMSKQFVEFLLNEENEKRFKRKITMGDVIQTLEMKTRIGQYVKTNHDIITKMKLYLFMQEAAANTQKQQQQQQMLSQQMQQQMQQQHH